jgi:hypothetical protein
MGPKGDPGTSGIMEFASLLNLEPCTIDENSPIIFHQMAAMEGIRVDRNGHGLILGDTRYYKVSFGITIESYTGSPTVELVVNGKPTAVCIPICGTGCTSIDWIDAFDCGDTACWVVRGGCIALASCGVNVYFSVLGIR